MSTIKNNRKGNTREAKNNPSRTRTISTNKIKNNIKGITHNKIASNKTKKMRRANNTSNNTSSLYTDLYKKDVKGKYVYKLYNPNDDSTVVKDKTRCMCINYKSIDDFNTYDRCNNQALQDSNFCQLHQNCRSYLRQFLSGDEPEPDQLLWKDPLVEGSHNCYSYFLNRQVKAVREKCQEICNKKYKSIQKCIDESECGSLKPQPGEWKMIQLTGTDKGKEPIYKCPEMHQRIMEDNPTLKPALFNEKCPKGYYKGALTIEPDSTYHFYKQINNGLFYHKPGLNPVSTVDSPFDGEKGRPIYVPHFANRDYSNDVNKNDDDGINYTSFCGYYCIPQNAIIHKNLA